MAQKALINRIHQNKGQLILLTFILLKIVLSYLWVNPVYELHRDEFLHLDQANHLAAGFTSLPPLTSLFSWLIKAFGNSVFMVKLVPALMGAVTILYCWKIVDFLKGNLLAKCLIAVACICSSLLRLNTLYQPNSFDVLAWTAIFYYLLRYFDKNEAKYLYTFAIFVALGFLNKYNVLFLIIGLLPAILITSNRKVFVNKHLYLAILLALLIISPNVIWQINNHFPVLTHMKLLQATQLVHVNRIDFFIGQFLFFISSIFILLAGIGSLIFYKDFRKYSWIILTYIITLIVFSYFKAKDYYALGLYPVLLAFGAVYLSRVLAKKRILTGLLFAFNIGTFIYFLPLLMPVYSPDEIIANYKRFERVGALRWEDGKNHQLPQDYADMQGWKELATLVDSAYEKVRDKSTLLVRADNYGQAGAINYYSKYKNINAVSYNADYLYWFKMDKPIKGFIMITGWKDEDPQRKREQLYFGKITKIGEIKTPYAREKGAGVFLLEEAKPEVSTIIKSEIEEEKMTINEAQETVDRWIKTTGIRYFNELTNTAILMEEVGEVARIMARKYGEQSFKKSDEDVDLADEMADVMFVLICLANQTGIDLTDALEKNLEKKSIRDADRHKNNEKLQ